MPEPSETAPSGTAAQAGAQPNAPHVDLEKLADRVYQLLLADVRLGRARGESPLLPSRMGEG